MSEKKGTSKLLIVLLIVTIIVLVSVGSFFGYYVFIRPKTAGGNQAVNNSDVQKTAEEKTIALDEIITNLADENRNKYIKISLSLGYSDKKLDKEIPSKMSAIRNNILKYLMNKNSEDLRTPGLDKAISDLKNEINSVLKNGKITNIYINDFIIQ
jgi:flagellar protein FliL